MNKSDLILLFDYNRWANARVLAACEKLSAEELHAPAQASFGSLMGTLAHIYAAEAVWRMRLAEGASPTHLPAAGDFPNLATLRAAWGSEEEAMRRFLEGIGEEAVQQPTPYVTTAGVPQAQVLWQPLLQVAIHGAQFRAEAGLVLAGLGHSPGDLDFIFYLREMGI